MIAFVLYDAGVESRYLAQDRPALRIESGVTQAREAWHLAAQTRDRQATFPVLLHLRG